MSNRHLEFNDQVKEIYPEDFLDNIHSCLSIIDDDKKIFFNTALYNASEIYLTNKNLNENRLSNSVENKKLEQLESYLEKAGSIYSELFEESKGGAFRFLSSLESLETENKEEKEILLNIFYKNGILKSENIKNFLKVLENTAHNSQKENYSFSKINKTNQVLFWLWGFSDEWEKYSHITLSEGRYDEKEMKYISPAMSILDELAKPLGISNSQIAEAIKLHRKNKNQEK